MTYKQIKDFDEHAISAVDDLSQLEVLVQDTTKTNFEKASLGSLGALFAEAEPTVTQFADLYDRVSALGIANYGTVEELSDVEKELAYQYVQNRNGKIYCVEFYKYSTNTTSSAKARTVSTDGGKTFVDSDLACTPSTDAVEGVDDFINDSIIFTWKRCNYIRDDDGTARLVALKGTPAYAESGAVDVGTIAPIFWWAFEELSTSWKVYMSDSPCDSLGLVPWVDAVKVNGNVLPYYIESAFPSVTASDGYLRSQPNLPVAYNQSYNSCITAYQKKGAGYWGAGASRTLHGLLFLYMKYGTQNSQNYFYGCTGFTTTATVAVAETGATRVLTTSSAFISGCCVCIGTTNLRSASSYTWNRVRVKSVTTETVDGASYYCLNLDTTVSADTTVGMYIISMPCYAGETEDVIGICDGSHYSNTSWKNSYRIHGCEYNWGQWLVECDSVFYQDSSEQILYTAPKGVAHVNTKADVVANYVESGRLPKISGYGADPYLNSNGSYNMQTIDSSGSSGKGCGDYNYGNSSDAVGTLHEKLALGYLWYGSAYGLSCLNAQDGLSSSGWGCGSCD